MGFDANVLIYAADGSAGDKHALATNRLRMAIRSGSAFLPAQVLGEFYWTRTRKQRCDPGETLGFINAWCAVARIKSYNDRDIVNAVEASRTHNLAFWDALIWAVCDRIGVSVLASEDFQDGRRLGHVTFLNPFNPANAARLGLPTG